jgi:esterase/lipase
MSVKEQIKHIYFISGLGADERVFDFLRLDNSIRKHFIKWQKPEPYESIETYAKRLSQQIDQSKNFALTGLSFGGMIAVEMTKYIKPSKIIIISSARDKNAISALYKLAGKLRLHEITPGFILKSYNFISRYFFGIESKEDKELFKNILKDTDLYFLRWALGEIIRWKNQRVISGLIQIHGTKDRIIKYRQANYTIEGGGHFMIVNKAGEISEIINSLLKD